MPAKKKNFSFIDTLLSPKGIIAFFFILVLISVSTYFYARRSASTKNLSQKITAKPTPTPIRLYPDDGVKGTFNISQGKHTGPNIDQIVFNPLNATKGQPLSITAKITDTVPVQTVTGVFTMDNGTQNVSFTRISGTDINGVWQTTMTLSESVFYDYIIWVTATSANGTNSVGSAPRAR